MPTQRPIRALTGVLSTACLLLTSLTTPGTASAETPSSALPPLLTAYTDADRTDTQWSLTATHTAAAWTASTGSGVIVATIDTGADADNPDLTGQLVGAAHLDPITDRIVAGARRDLDGHGTHVAGIIAAADDGHGITGVAPDAKIMPIDVNTVASLDGAQVATAIRWAAAHGARVVNLSLGEPNIEITADDAEPVCAAVADAVAAGVVIVAAAGNDGTGMNLPEVPATCPGAIAVAALSSAIAPTVWSSFDATVSVAAPGDDIYSTVPTFYSRLGYAMMSGTSMAAPFVAGVVALLLSQHPQWTPEQVRTQLEDTATDVAPVGVDPRTGHGVVDPAAALGVAAPPVAAVAHVSLTAASYPRPSPDGGITFDATYVNWIPDPGITVTGYTLDRFDADGLHEVNLPPTQVRYVDPVTSAGYTLTAHTPDGDVVSAPVWFSVDDTGEPPAFQVWPAATPRATWTPTGAIRVTWTNPDRNIGHADRWEVLINGEEVAGNQSAGRIPRAVVIPAGRAPAGDLRLSVVLGSTQDLTQADAALTLRARVPLSGHAIPAGHGRYRIELTVAPSWAARACGHAGCAGTALVVVVAGHHHVTWLDARNRATLTTRAPAAARRLGARVVARQRSRRALDMPALTLVVARTA